MIKFSLLGETILEWNDKDIEHYHARRMAMDSMLCRFKATYMNWQMKTPSTISYGCLYQNILWQRYQHDDSCIKSLVLFV